MARTSDLNPDDLDEFMALLEAAGIREVSMDPSDLNLPGVWVNVAGFPQDVLAGMTIRLELVCLAGEIDPRRALVKLAPLFNTVMPILAGMGGPAGDPVTVVVPMPGSSAPMPGISIPFDLLTTQPTEEP